MLDMFPYPNINANDVETIKKQINNYLINLKESLEFEFMKLSSENVSNRNSIESVINEMNTQNDDQMSQVSSRVISSSSDVKSAIEQTANEIRTEVSESYELKKDANEMYKELSSSIKQTEDAINLSVSEQMSITREYAETLADEAESNAEASTDEKLKSYSTTTEMQSAIDMSAEAINLEVSKKVNGDEVVSTINQSAEEVKIDANKISLEGLVTINGGFEVDENGSVKMNEANLNGTFSQKDKNGKQSVKIENNKVDFHNWNGQGEFVGTIATVKDSSSDRSGIAIGCKEGSDITLSVINANGSFVPVFQINGDSYKDSPPWIRNTVSGKMSLILGIDTNSDGTISQIRRGSITFKNGLISEYVVDNWEVV